MNLDQIQAFLEVTNEVGFKGGNREEVYCWVNQTLRERKYEDLKRSGRGLVRRMHPLRQPAARRWGSAFPRVHAPRSRPEG